MTAELEAACSKACVPREEREEMLRKGVLHCTNMGNLPVGEHIVRTFAQSPVKSILKSELDVAAGGYGDISV